MQAIRYKEWFLENVVMTMAELRVATGQPRESILRDLKSVGYYSSYNARGKFYTLVGIPEFDSLGLWKFRNAFFSNKSTLLDTAEHLVNISNAGYTHDELRRILGIDIQNSLYRLITAGRIARRQVGSQYVYFGIENSRAQIEKRDAMPTSQIERKGRTPVTKRYPEMDKAVIIDILVAVLRGHDTDFAAYSYLTQTGSKATEQQVSTVLHHYGIGKKNSPDRKRS